MAACFASLPKLHDFWASWQWYWASRQPPQPRPASCRGRIEATAARPFLFQSHTEAFHGHGRVTPRFRYCWRRLRFKLFQPASMPRYASPAGLPRLPPAHGSRTPCGMLTGHTKCHRHTDMSLVTVTYQKPSHHKQPGMLQDKMSHHTTTRSLHTMILIGAIVTTWELLSLHNIYLLIILSSINNLLHISTSRIHAINTTTYQYV